MAKIAETPAGIKGLSTPSPLRYWAFLSYSHSDSAWAEWLHQTIETYRVPRQLVGRATPDGPTPRRLFPVFRDRDELPGASELGEKVNDALGRSRYLLVVCSPHAAASRWVDAEIRKFKALAPENERRVLCLIVGGEPHASDQPEQVPLECFPPAVRYQVDGEGQLTDRLVEPAAADAREGKDGRNGALLKLLAGILGVGLDELRQRERARQRRRQVRQTFAMAGVVAVITLSYLGMADLDLPLPGSKAVRAALDRHAVSVFRRAHGSADISAAAVDLRRRLRTRFQEVRSGASWMPRFLAPLRGAAQQNEVWAHSQAVTAVFSDPDATNDELAPFVASLTIPFVEDPPIQIGTVLYGWAARPERKDLTLAQPALWTASALALALGRAELLRDEQRSEIIGYLTKAQAVLATYRPAGARGGWAMFPLQDDPEAADAYTTVLALGALLDARKANLPWEGSVETRDALVATSAKWLVDHFDAQHDPPGWRAGSSPTDPVIDGLTLQIYSTLLRGESEAGVVVPPVVLEAMTRHIVGCADRRLEFPDQSGEFQSYPFTNHVGFRGVESEGVNFFWYPWAIAASARWLARAELHTRPAEDVYRVRRALGHLVIDLGLPAVTGAVSSATGIAAEHLYGLSTVGLPQ